MDHTEQRRQLRAILAGSKCLSPAAVYDPLSALVAQAVGYEVSILQGSVASHTTLAVPDLTAVLTLTELSEQVRRIVRVTKLPMIVDAETGYGNALNVMRTVQELEHAGAAMISIEDTILPMRFKQSEQADKLISIEEMAGKLRAAVAARADPSLVIAGRTAALKVEDNERTIARVKAYATTGVDVIFLSGLTVGLKNLDQIERIHAAAKLPIVLGGGAPAAFKREDLAARGARIQLEGHQALAATVKALRETYTHLFNGGAPADLKSKIAPQQEIAALIDNENYQKRQSEYLC